LLTTKCEIPQNSPKIQGHPCQVIDFGANRKRICNFLLMITRSHGSVRVL